MKKKTKNIQTKNETPKFISSLLLIAYGFVTVLTPNFRTFDSNGPKFLSFAILNLVVFLILLNIKDIKKNLFNFFDGKIGFAYAILMILSLLSFTKSININESILHFSKVFTTFSAAWLVATIVRYDKNSLKPLAIAMSILLFIDSYQTFENISMFIKGKLQSIGLIKASYSNKNILSSAIFIKIPFAIWLFMFSKKWARFIGGLAMFTGFLATLFLGSRAFYMATLFVSAIMVVYLLIKYKKESHKKYLSNLGYYSLIVAASFVIFSFVQQNLYPKAAVPGTGLASRISTITDSDNISNNLRLTAWKMSSKLIKREPLLGVGLGNWKIRVLEYENQESSNYTYMYKNHNDFIETAAESGIIAGIAFLSMFVFVFLYFAIVLFKKPNFNYEKLLFLPAFGIFAYSFDAFFNFPQDRPEIQSLFSIYLGIGAGLALLFFKEDSPMNALTNKIKNKKPYHIILTGITGLLLIGSVYILYINVQSLKLQRIIKEEINANKLKSSSTRFIEGFPSIPDITILAEPIAVQKARYLINEKKYEQARGILRKDNSNPYDARKEYFMAMSYYSQKQYDSALYYSQQAHKLKPLFYNNNTIAASVYEQKGQLENSLELWKGYLDKVKTRSEPWLISTSLLDRLGRATEAKSLIDSAYKYLPNDKKIIARKNQLELKTVSGDYLPIYVKASDMYKQKNYKEAIKLYSEFIEKVPNFHEAYSIRASSYYHLKMYKEALSDIQILEKLVPLKPNLINMKAGSYYMLGDRDKAKKYFKKAMGLGSKDAANNYKRLFPKQ